MYEVEGKFRLAYELFYTGKQYTTLLETKNGYWVTGISAERRWKHFSLFMNAENFTDTRQAKSETMYEGSITAPQFKPIWGNTEGFILNGGARIFF
jgi:iron complex outermembrane receptor protein